MTQTQAEKELARRREQAARLSREYRRRKSMNGAPDTREVYRALAQTLIERALLSKSDRTITHELIRSAAEKLSAEGYDPSLSDDALAAAIDGGKRRLQVHRPGQLDKRAASDII